MNSYGDAELQELALRAMVARRCQRAYLHDLRGGLQAIASSFELLARVANTKPLNTDFLEKSTTFFKRATVEHERTLGKSLDDICGSSSERQPVDLRGLLEEVLRFLQNDALSKGVKFELLADDAVSVVANRSNVRLVVLSMLTQGMDQSDPDTTITLRVAANPRPAIDISGMTGEVERATVDLLVQVSKRLMSMDGGLIEATGNDHRSTGWSLRW